MGQKEVSLHSDKAGAENEVQIDDYRQDIYFVMTARGDEAPMLSTEEARWPRLGRCNSLQVFVLTCGREQHVELPINIIS